MRNSKMLHSYIVIISLIAVCAGQDANVRIYTNRMARHGQPHTIIITLETMIKKPFDCDIHAPNNLIDFFNTNVDNKEQPFDWRKTIDFTTTLKFFGINQTKVLDYDEGWFYRTKTTFWSFGTILVTVKISEKSKSKRYKPTTQSIIVHVDYLSVFSECLPKLIIFDCPPLEDGGRRFNFGKSLSLHGGYLESCGDFNVNQPYHWTVYDYLGRVELENLGYTAKPSWRFSGYYFSPQYVVNPLGAFQIRIESKIDGVNMMSICYMKPRRVNVVAKILGDATRNIPYGATFVLDGRQSRDPWLPPMGSQQLIYEWQCRPVSEEYEKECAEVSKFRGPVLSMKNTRLTGSYAFVLTVISKFDSNRNSTNVQFIDIKTTDWKELHVDCQENCAQDEFVPMKPIVIEVSCMNCNENDAKAFKWYANNENTPISEERKLNYVPRKDVSSLELTVTLEVKSPYGKNRNSMTKSVIHLRRNYGPQLGKCSASPGSGIERQTKFVIDCTGFESKQLPLLYCVMIDEMPIGHCSENPQVELVLPATTSANIMVCDAMHLCSIKSFKVNVMRSLVGMPDDWDDRPTVKELRKFKGNFMHGNMEHGFEICYEMARIVNTTEELEDLTYAMESYKPYSIVQLQQLLQFTRRLIGNFLPLSSKEGYLLSKIFKVIVDSLEDFIFEQSIYDIHISVYGKIADTLLGMVNQLMDPSDVIQNAQCKSFHSECLGYDDLSNKNYEQLETFDPTVAYRVDQWMHLYWEVQKCLFYLGRISFKHVKTNAEGRQLFKFSHFDLEHYYFELGKQRINITTNDEKHSVIISPELAKELVRRLGDNEIVVQLVVQKQGSLDWWYPVVATPSTKGIGISIYSATRMINETEQLTEPIEFVSQITDLNQEIETRKRGRRQVVRSTVAPDDAEREQEEEYVDTQEAERSEYVISGRLDAPYQAQVFRTELFSYAVLAVKFLTASIDLFVTMTVYEPTSILNLRDYSCELNAQRAYNTTFLMVNLCNRSVDAYIMVRSTLKNDDWAGMNGKMIEFSFEMESRTCNDWTFKRPEPSWQTMACFPHLNATLEGGMHCYCSFMSTFMTRTVPFKAVSMPGSGTGGELAADNRGYVILFYVILNLGLIIPLWILKTRVADRDELLPLAPEDHTTEIDGRGGIIVQLFLGGRNNYGSTADILLSFYSLAGEYNFIIYHKFRKNRFKLNETITLRLDNRYVSLPTLVAIGHNNFGRFPDFFLRSITIHDLENEMSQKFTIESWVHSTKMRYLSSQRYTGNVVDKKLQANWWIQFKKGMDFQFTNWFLFQPILGPWRHGLYDNTFNIFERSVIWTCKFAITLCIVACVYGRSTMHSCELTKKAYYEPIFFIPLAFICFLISCLVQWLMAGLVKRQHTHSLETL